MPLLFDGARVAYYDGNGDPLSGGKVYFYEAGTTTPKNTFSDAALSVPNTNPVVLDSAGRAGAIYLDGTYKIVVKTAADVTVFTQDDYSAVFTENVRQVATIAAMTALLKASLSNGDQVHVSGYTTAGDGGGGTFYWDSASSDTADGGTIFAADEGGDGRWIRVVDGPVFVNWYGATGVLDDRETIESAIAAAGGDVVRLRAEKYTIKTDLVLSVSHLRLEGAGFQSTTGDDITRLELDDGVKIKTSGSDGAVGARHLTLKNMRIQRVSGATSAEPALEILGAPDTKLIGVFISPSNRSGGTALRIRWSWNCILEDVWLWSAKYGLDGNSAVNALRMNRCNINDVDYGIVGGYNTLKVRESTIQQYTEAAIALGMDYGSVTTNSSTAPTIEDCYLGAETASAREIILGEDSWVRNPRIVGNYFAHITNPATKPPIFMRRVYGHRIENNFFDGSGADLALVEYGYHAVGGLFFPASGYIGQNNGYYTETNPPLAWEAGTTETQKFRLFQNERNIIEPWEGRVYGRKRIVRSAPLVLASGGPSSVTVPIMRQEHFGEIDAIYILCSDNVADGTNLTLEVGIPTDPDWYCSETQTSFDSNSITAATLINTRIHNDNRLILATLSHAGTLSAAGAVVVEIHYHDVIE